MRTSVPAKLATALRRYDEARAGLERARAVDKATKDAATAARRGLREAERVFVKIDETVRVELRKWHESVDTTPKPNKPIPNEK